MSWPKGKKRGPRKRQPSELQKIMDAPPSKGMAFYHERIEELERKGHGLYIGKCPKCGLKELRVFDEDPVEVRCAKCRFWAFGADQFAEFTEKLRREVDNARETGTVLEEGAAQGGS